MKETTRPAPPESWPRRWRGEAYEWRRRDRFGWTRRRRGSGPLRRVREGHLAGGVAAGLAARSGFDVTAVRLVFVLAALATDGVGVAAYVLAWLLVPAAGSDSGIASKARTDRRGIAQGAALGSLLVVALLITSVFGSSWLFTFAWPQVISVPVLLLIWRNAPADEQETMRHLVEPLSGLAEAGGRSRFRLRASVAAVLLLTGIAALTTSRENIDLLRPLGGVLLVAAAIAVMLGPWWLRVARDLGTERQARVRAEERADMATRVHDSVLQTLALIQRRADDPQQVVQLARAQERELRSWLFEGRAPGTLGGAGMTFADGVRLIQQEVEAQHGISVEAVTVGDCELDDNLAALLAAAREATVNAAKWSGEQVVSLFAEVEATEVSLFVRDRGRGFDPEAVPGDRKGLAESVRARMTRRGGSVTVSSAPGTGTKVSLSMPRTAEKPQPSRA